MRIVVVSAHYPPNFVSGGTLQPQRLARGLRDRGHDVSVFAGWLGDREPLDTWDETDETGMAVRWIASGPFIGWADERNWHNPGVNRVFERYLREIRPDVVHLHSLQSLGAGLAPVAKDMGAALVVTMHDFWWLCTRQFLVDHDYQPCCLVQQAGTCPCEVDIATRDSRRAALATLLGSADLVLAPSQMAADVLNANGVAGGLVEVDENGLPPEALSPAPASVTPASATGTAAVGTAAGVHGDLRFLYAGGPNPMKGVHILLDATEAIRQRSGWRLSMYGIDEYLERSGRSVDGSVVDVLAPYEPDQLHSVLAAHDVLVLPSVMRETHSLLTREALSAGLVVICTDTLGPEEVVHDGRNGLIVPAADAESLAGAMGSLVGDAALLGQLRSGAREPIRARTIDDQVAGLEKRFEALVSRKPDGAVSTGAGRARSVGSVLFVCGIEGAPLRYRARLPAEALALVGIESEVRHYRDPELTALIGTADVVVFYRVPATHQVLDLIHAARGSGIPVAFDVDDLIFDPDIRDEIPALRLLPADEAALWLQGVERYRTTLEACDAYIGSTQFLVEHAASLTGLPSFRFDNGVGLITAHMSDDAVKRDREPGPVRIGYLSGTTTHDEDWFFVEPAVTAVLDRYDDVELWLGGHLPDSPGLARFGGRVRRLPFLDWRELPGVLRDLDVNLAPLAPGSRFNEAKSAIKWLEAALCATPTVASPTGPFREAIRHGETGLLADGIDDWAACIEGLVTDVRARSRIGGMARRDALLRWSPASQARRYRSILEGLVETTPTRTPTGSISAWEPVALDEPPVAGIRLEPYEDLPGSGDDTTARITPPDLAADVPEPGPWQRRAARIGSLTDRGLASVRSNGVRSTLKKASERIRSRISR